MNDLVQAFEEPPPTNLEILSPTKTTTFFQPPKSTEKPTGLKQFSKDKIKFVKPITNGPHYPAALAPEQPKPRPEVSNGVSFTMKEVAEEPVKKPKPIV